MYTTGAGVDIYYVVYYKRYNNRVRRKDVGYYYNLYDGLNTTVL